MSLSHFTAMHPTRKNFERCLTLLDRSQIDVLLDRAATPARPRGGPHPSTPYSARAVLLAFMLTMAEKGEVTLAKMFDVLWHMTADQLAHVALEEYITPDALERLEHDYDDRVAEYYAFRYAFDRFIGLIDSSPHPRQKRERNAIRWQRVANLSPARKKTLAAREELFQVVVDRLTKASTVDAVRDHWDGSIALDETLVESFAVISGCGTLINEMGAADADAAWYRDKKSGEWKLWHRYLVVVPAVSPYSREMDNLAIGIRVRATQESNTDAAIAAVLAARRNGWLVASTKRPRVIGDQGYSREDYFALRFSELGYYTIADVDQKVPKFPRKTDAGHRLGHGGFICPAGAHISLAPLGEPPDERIEPPELVEDRQTTIDEIARYTAPTNGRPKIVKVLDKGTGRWEDMVAIQLICPHAAGQVWCPIPPSLTQNRNLPLAVNAPTLNPNLDPAQARKRLPACCQHAYVTAHVPVKVWKHTDSMIRGSYEHSDWYNYNRSYNERRFSIAKSPAAGAVDGRKIELMGRARAGLAVVIALCLQNMSLIERRERWYATEQRRHAARKSYSRLDRGPEKFKFTPREARRKARASIIKGVRDGRA